MQVVAVGRRHRFRGGTGRRFPALTGIVRSLHVIWLEEGVLGLTRGLGARMLVNAPSAAISWTTYEFVKSLLLQLGSRDAP